MALDWSKEISFSGLKKSKPKGKTSLPTKTYINLMPRKERTNDPRKVVPLAIVLVLLVALFAKFGVYDFFERVNQKSAELQTQVQLLNGLEAQLVDYDEVKAEYDAYESTRLASSEDEVSATEAMQLVDKFIAPSASIASLEYEANTITLNLANITLDGVGSLVSTLYEQDIVANVSVSTAGSEAANAEDSDLTAAMVITLQKAQGADDAHV